MAKEGLTFGEGEAAKEQAEELKKKFEPLTKWLAEDPLKDLIAKVREDFVFVLICSRLFFVKL